jgi:hypothetical protein
MIDESTFITSYFPKPSPSDEQVWEWEEVKDLDEHYVWTIVDGDDGNMYADPGFHIVNKVGYTVTEQPWSDDEFVLAEWCIFPMDADRFTDAVRDLAEAYTQGSVSAEDMTTEMTDLIRRYDEAQ